jgi:hypothetical protein
MPELSHKEIECIRIEIVNAGITFSHLQNDLLDHICCDIEIAMAQGSSFSEAFNNVRKEFGNKGLQQIQEDTILLIDKNYRMMKTLMKTVGVLSLIMIAFGTLFKIEHWPGAGILLVLGFFILLFIFLPSLVYLNYREVSNKTKAFTHIAGYLAGVLLISGFVFKVQHWPGTSFLISGGTLLAALIFLPALFISKFKTAINKGMKTFYTIGFVSVFIYLFAFLFKLNHWPGAGILLLLGSTLLVLVAFPIFVFQHYRKTEHVDKSFIFTTVALVWVVLPTMLISVNISKDIFKTSKQVNKTITEHLNYLIVQNDLCYARIKSNKTTQNTNIISTVDSIQNKTQALNEYLKEIKRGSVLSFNMTNRNTILPNGDVTTDQLQGIEETEAYKAFLNGEKATELKQNIGKYRDFLIAIRYNEPSSAKLISELLATKDYVDHQNKVVPWEMINFSWPSLGCILNTLTSLQEKVQIAESIAYNDLMLKK